MNSPPNILLIMPDQMRGDSLSLDGHPILKTPVLDRIGSDGAYFSRGYTTCPSCIPARRSLLTGLYPFTGGMVGYKEGLPIDVPTLPQLMSENGYATSLAGRYMHQYPADKPYGFENQTLGSTYIRDDDYAKELAREAPDVGSINEIGLSCNGRGVIPWPADEKLHPTTWAIEQSRRMLSEHENDRPIFHVSSYYAPHPPLFPPENYLNEFLDGELPPISIGSWAEAPPQEVYQDNLDSNQVDLKGEELRKVQSGYYGLIKHIDDRVEKMIEEFKAKSLSMGRPWIILLTSDHGDMLGDHYLFRKCEPYEGSTRIPFLIQASKELGFVEGLRCGSPVCLEDIMPTLLECSGIPIPEKMDGKSLAPILRGQTDTVRQWLHGEHATCYSEAQAFHMLTDGRWKFIWRPSSGEEQLFDLSQDPNECTNLSADIDHQKVTDLIREKMVQLLTDRPEGFVVNGKLVSGCEYPPICKT